MCTRSLHHLYFLKSTIINVTIRSKSVSKFKTNSTFTSIPSFSLSNYAAACPRYTEGLSHRIIEYLKSSNDLSLDLALTLSIVTYLRFNRVIDLDPFGNTLNEATRWSKEYGITSDTC